MRLVLTPEAYQDLADTLTYLAEEQHATNAARRFVTLFDTACEYLLARPYMGRKSHVGDSREITMSHYPYTIVYRVLDDAIVITTLFHESQNPVKKHN